MAGDLSVGPVEVVAPKAGKAAAGTPPNPLEWLRRETGGVGLAFHSDGPTPADAIDAEGPDPRPLKEPKSANGSFGLASRLGVLELRVIDVDRDGTDACEVSNESQLPKRLSLAVGVVASLDKKESFSTSMI